MHKSAIITLRATFDEFEDFVFEMLGTAHDIAIQNVEVDREHRIITFYGKEDKSSTRKHEKVQLDKLFGDNLSVNSKKIVKGTPLGAKKGLSAYLKAMFDEPNIRIPYPKIQELCERDGFAQGRTHTHIKSCMYSIGIRQLDPNVYGYPIQEKVQITEDEMMSQ